MLLKPQQLNLPQHNHPLNSSAECSSRSDVPPAKQPEQVKRRASEGMSHMQSLLSESLSKRCKFIKKAIDEGIERCCKGKTYNFMSSAQYSGFHCVLTG